MVLHASTPQTGFFQQLSRRSSADVQRLFSRARETMLNNSSDLTQSPCRSTAILPIVVTESLKTNVRVCVAFFFTFCSLYFHMWFALLLHVVFRVFFAFPWSVRRILLTGKVLISAEAVPPKKQNKCKNKTSCVAFALSVAFILLFFNRNCYLMVGRV